MEWTCSNCGKRNDTDSHQCTCGYQATQYDLAASTEDTGQYLVNRISVPSIEILIEKQTAIYTRMAKIIVITMLSGVVLISLLLVIFKLISR